MKKFLLQKKIFGESSILQVKLIDFKSILLAALLIFQIRS